MNNISDEILNTYQDVIDILKTTVDLVDKTVRSVASIVKPVAKLCYETGRLTYHVGCLAYAVSCATYSTGKYLYLLSQGVEKSVTQNPAIDDKKEEEIQSTTENALTNTATELDKNTDKLTEFPSI